MDNVAAIAAIRFGLGCTPGQAPSGDPVAWLQQQLAAADPGPPAASVAEAFTAQLFDREARKTQAAQGEKPGWPEARVASRAREIYRSDTHALLTHAVTTPLPFRERLVAFWSNHFTVSIRNGQVAPLVGSFVREAIRPGVTGRFGDMLLAVMRHPAMLLYLDNVQSAGPGSPIGGRPNRGLNENLARECLELHTVSPAAGYSQADVTEFARVLTGWSIDRQQEPLGFRFRPAFHDPGEKQVMGRRFAPGEEGGVQALLFLASHPATYRHLATKLVRHFVMDTPPADAVRRIEGVLRDSGGHLGRAAAELIRLPAAWQPMSKVRNPQDYVVAAVRAANLVPERRPDLMQLIAGLGQPAFGAPFPIGWPDTAGDWTGPEAMMRRVDWAYGFASRPELPEPLQLADAALGPLLSASTAAEIRRAGSRRDGITLLLSSPEFQRR